MADSGNKLKVHVLSAENDAALWDSFADASPQGTVFHLSAFLKCVAGEAGKLYFLACVRDKDILGGMPVYELARAGRKKIVHPPLTPWMGVCYKDFSSMRYEGRMGLEKSVSSLLAKYISEHYDYFCQNFHYAFTDWQPFMWENFMQTTRYTYVVKNTETDLDAVWKGVNDKTRNSIRKAGKNGVSIRAGMAQEFLKINKMTFDRKKMSMPYSDEIVLALEAELKPRGLCDIILAEDGDGNIHAGAFIVHDRRSAYYLLGGMNPEHSRSQAMSLLLWESIKKTCAENKCFDFEGSDVPALELYFRSFGAQQTPYFLITMDKRTFVEKAASKVLKR